MPPTISRVAQANAVVEEQFEDFSDEMEEVSELDPGEEMDTSQRVSQPKSYNRSLKELFRTLFQLPS